VTKLKELAAEALSVQDACNLRGLGVRFGEVCGELGPAMQAAGLATDTEAVNRHPIMQVWVNKMAQLAGCHGAMIGDAFFEVQRIAGQG
jgi:hypothetical protein